MDRRQHFAELIAQPFLRLPDLKVAPMEVHHDGQSFLCRIGPADIEGQPALGANGTAACALEVPLAGLRTVQHTRNLRRGLRFTPAICACCGSSVRNAEPLLYPVQTFQSAANPAVLHLYNQGETGRAVGNAHELQNQVVALLKGTLECLLVRIGHCVFGKIARVRVKKISEVVACLYGVFDVFVQRHVCQIPIVLQYSEHIGETAIIVQHVQYIGVLGN